MYGCDLIFTPATAAKVRAEISDKMGSCPCEDGRRCPLLPEDLGPLLTPVAPRRVA